MTGRVLTESQVKALRLAFALRAEARTFRHGARRIGIGHKQLRSIGAGSRPRITKRQRKEADAFWRCRRAMFRADDFAKMLGVSPAAVWRAAKGQTYRDVPQIDYGFSEMPYVEIARRAQEINAEIARSDADLHRFSARPHSAKKPRLTENRPEAKEPPPPPAAPEPVPAPESATPPSVARRAAYIAAAAALFGAGVLCGVLA